MATQILATLTTDHHLPKCGIVVYLVNPRHLFHSILLDVCFVSKLDRCCYVSFCELILSCSVFEKIDSSRVFLSSCCHVGWSSQSKTSRQRWWTNQRSFEVQPGSWRLYQLRLPFTLPYAWISRRDSGCEVRRQRGHGTDTVFTIHVALHNNVDSIIIFDYDILSFENFIQHGDKRARQPHKNGSSILMNTRSTHGMRRRNISRAETWNIHPEGWSVTDDEGSLGRQQFHA